MLVELLSAEKLAGASLLVFVNKIDLLPESEKVNSPAEKALRGALSSVENRHWNIVNCSAYTGEGLREGIDWIVEDISSRIFMFD